MNAIHGLNRLAPVFVRSSPLFAMAAAVAAVASMFFLLIQKVDQYWDRWNASLRDEIIQHAVMNVKGSSESISFRGEERLTPYHQLEPEETDKETIHSLIQTIGVESKISLLVKVNAVESLGKQINHVYPLKFLEVIFKEPHLVKCLRGVMSDYFKRTRFMNRLGENLAREADSGALEHYLADFQRRVGKVNLEIIQRICKSREWEALINYLLQEHK